MNILILTKLLTVTLNLVDVTETGGYDGSGTYLTYGFGGGFLINEKIDIAAEYRIVSGDGGSLAYILILVLLTTFK